MFPANKRDALVSTLEAEAAFRDLALSAYKYWVPLARTWVLPSLTAAGEIDELPPDPAAIANSQFAWELALDSTIVYGAGLLYANQMLDALVALGGELPAITTPAEIPVEETSASTLRAEARRTVARSLGQDPRTVAALERRVAKMPSVRALQSRYLSAVRNRMVNTPDTVFRAIASDIDHGIAAGESPIEMRARVEARLDPLGDNWRNRALTVARTESAGAMSAATIEAAEIRNADIGETLEKSWMCTLDSKTRKSHYVADGQRVALKGKFKVGKSDMDHPGDPAAPAEETVNCRCRVIIVAADEALPVETDRQTERGPTDSTVKNRAGSRADEIARRAADGQVRAREDPNGVGTVAASAAATLTDKFEETAVTAPVVDEAPPADAPEDAPPAPDVETPPAEDKSVGMRKWEAVVAVIGTPTDDRRILAKDIDLTFRTFPLPLMWTKQNEGGHLSAFTVGVIQDASVSGATVIANGYLLDTPEADEAAGQIEHGVTGPSVDLADADWLMTDINGTEIAEEQWDDPDLVVYATVTKAVLLGVTLVATPAFGDTSITLLDDVEESPEPPAVVAALVASGGRYVEPTYKAEFFTDPQLTEPTYPTIDNHGRIFGHLATWNVCHVGIQDRCVLAPHSTTDYAWFHTSPPVLTDDGKRVKVGRLTVGGGHADGRLGVGATVAHYDNEGNAFALVHMGEDAIGPWFSGVAAPGATAEQITRGLRAALSGDWRSVGGNLELVAALSVNTPGFPLVASGATDSFDRPLSLVASLGPCRDSAEAEAAAVDLDLYARKVVREMRAAERRDREAREILASHRRREALALIAKVK